MKKLIAVLCLALASLAFYRIPVLFPEPTHQGRPLRAWLTQLQAPDEGLRAEAGLALCRMRAQGTLASKPAAQALISVLGDRSVRVQQIALAGLFRICLDDRAAVRPALPELVKILKGKDAVNRSMTAQLLGMIGAEPKTVVPLLTEALSDPGHLVRSGAALGLREIGHPARAAVPALVEALRDGDNLVSANAELALKAIDPEAAARAGVR